ALDEQLRHIPPHVGASVAEAQEQLFGDVVNGAFLEHLRGGRASVFAAERLFAEQLSGRHDLKDDLLSLFASFTEFYQTRFQKQDRVGGTSFGVESCE